MKDLIKRLEKKSQWSVCDVIKLKNFLTTLDHNENNYHTNFKINLPDLKLLPNLKIKNTAVTKKEKFNVNNK